MSNRIRFGLKTKIWTLLLFLFLIDSCKDDTDHIIVEGEFFEARVGHYYRTKSNSFIVTQVADSRCPVNATCIIAGEAKVYLAIFSKSKMDTTLNLGGHIADSRMLIDSLYYELNSVTPVPRIGKGIKQKEYRIEMKVSRN